MIFGKRRGRKGSKFVEARPTLGEGLMQLGEGEGGLSQVLAIVGAVVLWPFRLAALTFEFLIGLVVAAWLGARARRVKHLLQGLPAAIVGLLIAVTAVVAAEQASTLTDTYRSIAADAYLADRNDEARLYYERLFRLDGGMAETRLLLGLTLEKLGRQQEAEQLIQGVADGDGGGDPRANLWMSSKLLADPQIASDKLRMSMLRRHVELAYKGMPRDLQATLNYARYHVANGERARAIPLLESVASTDPAVSVDLGRLYASVGRADDATAAFARAETRLEERLAEQGEDERTRLLLASILASSGRMDEAVKVLQDGMKINPAGPYAAALSTFYVAAYDRLRAENSQDRRAMIAMLAQALQYNPKSVEAALRLAGFGSPASSPTAFDVAARDPVADAQATKLLEELLAAGEQPAAVHLALGIRASRTGDDDAAQWHYERAYELDATLADVANNLAWTMSHRAEPDLERALAIIGPVLERQPNVATYLDTRGEIFRQMERWDAALADFERALPSMKTNARLHRSMAEVYAKLGKEEISAQHLRQAEQIAVTGAAGAGKAADEAKPVDGAKPDDKVAPPREASRFPTGGHRNVLAGQRSVSITSMLRSSRGTQWFAGPGAARVRCLST